MTRTTKTKSALHIDDAVRHFVRTQYPNMEFVFAYDDGQQFGCTVDGPQINVTTLLGLANLLTLHLWTAANTKGGSK